MKHMSKKLIQKVETVAENLGWTVSGTSDGDDWLFSIGSPEGQDCNIELSSPDLDNLKQDLKNYVEGYDVSYEAYLWLDKWGHGTNGAPYDMRDLYNDMEWFFNKATELSDAVSDIS